MVNKRRKCDACEYNSIEFSPFLHAWVVCCNRRVCQFEAKKSKGLNVVPRDKEREKELLELRI